MKLYMNETSEKLGKAAAEFSAAVINRVIAEKGKARIVLSTGASQFDTLKALVEYINLPETHPASFRKYLRERFTGLVNLKSVNFVNGEGDIRKNITELTRELRKEPIDLGLIGIGENGHIAFNDPPADFDTRDAYIVVNLDEDCKKQQVGEGWFPTVVDVPKQAISMSVYQIMQCNVIVSCVPHKVKAKAVKLTMDNDLTNMIPATMLKTHKDFHLFLDNNSSSLLSR